MTCCTLPEILPFTAQIEQLKEELLHARCKANYYENLHQRNVEIRERLEVERREELFRLKQEHEAKEKQLLQQINDLQAKLKLRERQLYGAKSEKQKSKKEASNKPGTRRKRGQQSGTTSPPRRDYSDLPIEEDFKQVPPDELHCPHCNAPYVDLGSSEDNDVIEVDVKAHIRRIKRRKYMRTCHCHSQPMIITAPVEPRVVPKSIFGNSVWTDFLVKKFWNGLPLYRIIQDLSSHGLNVSFGTIVGGFSKLSVLLQPVYEKIQERNLLDQHWNADETGWKVFENVEGKAGNKWFLWIFKSESSSVYILDPFRSTKVLKKYFGDETKGIISCDRYAAYFCFVEGSSDRFLIAFCWAHVRRDFVSLARDRPEHETWAMSWVEEIRKLYAINKLRVAALSDDQKFTDLDRELRKAIFDFKKRAKDQLEKKALPIPCRKILESLERHWHGLTTFLENPTVPMDNNSAERGLRGSVVGRKNYYGSGSVKSAYFTAMMFTIIQTLLIWQINPRLWLSKFFNYRSSYPEESIDSWLPWNMDKELLAILKLKSAHDPPHGEA